MVVGDSLVARRGHEQEAAERCSHDHETGEHSQECHMFLQGHHSYPNMEEEMVQKDLLGPRDRTQILFDLEDYLSLLPRVSCTLLHSQLCESRRIRVTIVHSKNMPI